MSLQPGDLAAEAFERLRSEVALLRRAVEGLAADPAVEPVDYSPTLAELSAALADLNARVAALGEQPALALTPAQMGALLMQGTARLMARPIAELEKDRAALGRAIEALRAAREADLVRSRSWPWVMRLVGAGAVVGAMLWGLLLGPFARMLPAAWGTPERLAAATLALPMAPAADRLLRRGEPEMWEALQLVRTLPASQVDELRRCVSHSSNAAPAKCTLKLRGG